MIKIKAFMLKFAKKKKERNTKLQIAEKCFSIQYPVSSIFTYIVLKNCLIIFDTKYIERNVLHLKTIKQISESSLKLTINP